jgi:hypothetical protein
MLESIDKALWKINNKRYLYFLQEYKEHLQWSKDYGIIEEWLYHTWIRIRYEETEMFFQIVWFWNYSASEIYVTQNFII